MRDAGVIGLMLLPILGRPMLELQIERIRRSRLVDDLVLATSVESQDDPLEGLAKRLGIACFRGSETDLLARVAGALKTSGGELHAEFFGDSPLPDPLLIDQFIGFYLKHAGRYDVVTSALKTTYPPGMEVTVYPSRLLFDAEQTAQSPEQREHVSLGILGQPERYRICNLEAPPEFHQPELYLEVDTREDFEVVSAVYEHLYPGNPEFGLAQILEFMKEHPELANRNRQVERRWKAYRQEAAR
jgi:spore coat polysaccharide biosynthesis protein SpsF